MSRDTREGQQGVRGQQVVSVCVCVCCRVEDGRLLDYLVAHDELMEEKVAFFIRETLEALQHLHTCRVAHLDLKVRGHAPSHSWPHPPFHFSRN